MHLNETHKAKIDRFLRDEFMSGGVFEVLLKSFMKPKPNSDVNLKATQMMAIDLLHEGWRELEKFRSSDGNEVGVGSQVGM